MKKICTLILLLMLPGLYRAALGEIYYRGTFDKPPYYHLSARCSLVNYADPVAIYGDIQMYNLSPCPYCIPDDDKHQYVEACERGGTVVVRVPDDSIYKALNTDALPASLPDGLIHTSDRQEDDLARLVHGEKYLACLAMSPGDEILVDVCIPELQLNEDDLLMSQRHLGAAWYFVIRQNNVSRKTMADGGVFDVSFRYYRVMLRVCAWSSQFTIEDVEETSYRDMNLRLKVKHSANKVVYNSSAVLDTNQLVTVFKDREVFTCVIKDLIDYTKGRTKHRIVFGDNQPNWIELQGYLNQECSIYCLVLTAGELQMIKYDYFTDSIVD